MIPGSKFFCFDPSTEKSWGGAIPVLLTHPVSSSQVGREENSNYGFCMALAQLIRAAVTLSPAPNVRAEMEGEEA